MVKGVFIPVEPGHTERTHGRLEGVDLGRYVGGQIEVHVDGGILSGGKVYRGDIARIAIEGDDLVVELAWLGLCETPGVWTADPMTRVAFGVPLLVSVQTDDADRVIMQAPIINQTIVLFPPGYTVDGEVRRLDRSALR